MAQWARWEPCEGNEAAVALSQLAASRPEYFADATLVAARRSRLTFYPDHRLMELQFTRDTRA